MTKQEQIAAFVDEHISFPRRPYSILGGWEEGTWYDALVSPQPRPTPEELAHGLLANAEFRGLQLGTWLNTPDGQVIAEAVELVAPPFYRQDIELLVQALQLAAQLQRQGGQQRAKIFSLLGVAAVTAIGIVKAGSAAA